MEFGHLIDISSKIKMRYFAFFFDCCRPNCNTDIKVPKMRQENVVFYSSPPGEVSYHYKDVGLMVICLSELLKGSYEKSLRELPHDLRDKMMKRMLDIMVIPEQNLGAFINRHLPLYSCAMFSDISLYEKTRNASS